MFELNEAPRIALAAISSEDARRGCGMFWGILCCIPTLGSSVGCDQGEGSYKGCYPEPVSLESEGGLKALTDTLHWIKTQAVINADQKQCDTQLTDRHKVIEWEVVQTVNVLKDAIRQNHIQGGYMEAIKTALITIESRAQAENSFSKAIKKNKEKVPLVEDAYVPSYGFGK